MTGSTCGGKRKPRSVLEPSCGRNLRDCRFPTGALELAKLPETQFPAVRAIATMTPTGCPVQFTPFVCHVNVLVGQLTAVKSASLKARHPRPMPSIVALGVIAGSAANSAPASSREDHNGRGIMALGWSKARLPGEPKRLRDVAPIWRFSLSHAERYPRF